MILQELCQKKLISPPSFLLTNTCYLVITGSQAYGVSSDNSDTDISGFAIPRKDVIFPHFFNYIPGFGTPPPKFDQYQQTHILDKSTGKSYDLSVYNIIKLFELARQGNPNIIDLLFVPATCVLHSTPIGNLVRENRRLFLSKKCWPKYKGYAYAQYAKMFEHNSPDLKELMKFEEEWGIPHHTTFMESCSNFDKGKGSGPLGHLSCNTLSEYYQLYRLMVEQGKRSEGVKINGMDLKYCFHLFRLLNFAEQILMKGDLDLQENREQLKSVRRGEWPNDKVRQYFQDKERQLEEIFLKSSLRAEPDEEKLKEILLECLSLHYGTLQEVIPKKNQSIDALRSIDSILDKLKTKGIL